jgi:hypothetical protein
LSHSWRRIFRRKNLETAIECRAASWPWLFF